VLQEDTRESYFDPNLIFFLPTEQATTQFGTEGEGALKIAKGTLVLSDAVMQSLGCRRRVIADASMSLDRASKDDKNGYTGVESRVRLPVQRLAPLIHELDNHMSLNFGLGPRSLIALMHGRLMTADHFPDTMADYINRVTPSYPLSTAIVDDWPGNASNAVSYENIIHTLYSEAQAGKPVIRARYWINPTTGLILKEGSHIPKGDYHSPAGTVWDVVEHYITPEQGKPRLTHYQRNRAASFTWWALKLGLTPPPNLMEKLEAAGLGFRLPKPL